MDQNISKKKRYVSHTKLNTLQECEAKFRHYYIRKIEQRKRPVYFTFGEAAHKFLEIYYSSKGKKIEEATREAIKIFQSVDRGLLTPEEIHTLEIEQSKVEGICQAYPKFYNKDFLEFETMMTELSYRKDKGILLTSTRDYDVYYEGDIDGLFQDAAGDWWIVEHKFLAPQTITQSFLEKVHIDSQVLGYMWLAKERAIGEFPRGVIYNIIKKPSIRLKKGETREAFATRVREEYITHGQTKEYFIRHDPQISQAHLDTWWKEKAHLANYAYTRIGIRSGMWPKNTGACHNNYGSCQYLNACVTGKYNRLIYTKREK